MVKVVQAEEMRRLEREADARGHSYAAMMELAGRATAEAVAQRLPGGGARVLALVGPGNNGGDGLVACRYLQQWGHRACAYLWCRRGEADAPLAQAQEAGVELQAADDDPDRAVLQRWAGESQAVLDALLGTGARTPLSDDLRTLLQAAREAATQPPLATPTLGDITALPSGRPTRRPLWLAVDLPTGVDADSGHADPGTVPADVTVTFAHVKRGLVTPPGAEHAGRVLVADIGLDRDLWQELPIDLATPAMVGALLPERPATGHKGTFGKVMVVAGSANYVGAPRLAAQGAYRCGAGLVTLALAAGVYRAVAPALAEATYLVLRDDLGALVPEAVDTLAQHLPGYDALLVGPGLGREAKTAEFLRALLAARSGRRRKPIGFAPTEERKQRLDLPPLVLDADALNLLAQEPEWWGMLPEGTVLTPHPGEMARLLGSEKPPAPAERLDVALRASETWGHVVLLKGAYSVIAAPDGSATVLPFANPALASAGTGDVLAGAVAALRAQGLSPYGAAICAAGLHAIAGELWRNRNGAAGLMAGDLPALLPRAWRCCARGEQADYAS